MRSGTEAATAGINLREGVGGLHLWGEASFLLPQQGDTEKRERTSVRFFSQREELLSSFIPAFFFSLNGQQQGSSAGETIATGSV